MIDQILGFIPQGGSFLMFAMGIGGYFLIRVVFYGFYTVDQNERAVKTSFGRAQRVGNDVDPMLMETLQPDEQERYHYPQVRVIPPGGPYFKTPWQRVYKVSVATETINMAQDLEVSSANNGGTILEAVTRDQLNIGLSGQLRFRVSERNLYAYLFGVKNPIVHVMGFFVSILRSRIANFRAQSSTGGDGPADAVSINDLRKNLRDINDQMVLECKSAEARYGVVMDASLITAIDPPAEVESALAAINTAHNNVSSEISRAQASADQTIVQSKRAVEIETLKAQAEVEPLLALAEQLRQLKTSGPRALDAFVRNVRLGLFYKVSRAILQRGA